VVLLEVHLHYLPEGMVVKEDLVLVEVVVPEVLLLQDEVVMVVTDWL
jgi:hypothetical protein